MVSDAISCPLHNEYPLVYYHDTSQLCKIRLDDVAYKNDNSRLLSELFPLDGFAGPRSAIGRAPDS